MADRAARSVCIETANGLDYAAVAVLPALPAGTKWRPEGGEHVMRGLVGATILAIGGPADGDIEGGGLVIDYLPKGETKPRRVVFGFNDQAMWLEWVGHPKQPNQAASRQ